MTLRPRTVTIIRATPTDGSALNGRSPCDERPVLVHAPEDRVGKAESILLFAPCEPFSRYPLPAPRSFLA
jgi:hypothetical protein